MSVTIYKGKPTKRSLDPWQCFLKFLNKVISERLHIPKLFIIDLLLFAKLLELLAINHSFSERRTIFVPLLLKFSQVLVFYNLHGCPLSHSWVEWHDSVSTLSRMSGFLQHSSSWAHQFRDYYDYYYYDYYAPTTLFLEPLQKVMATFRGKMQQLFGYILIDRYLTPAVLSLSLSLGPEALCWIIWPISDILSPSAFLCCHYIFDSCVTCLTLSFNTLYVYFHSHDFFVCL